MEKVLSFCPKSTIVLTEKYYRFSERYIPSSKKLRTFLVKRLCLFLKRYILFQQKVYSFSAKDIYFLGKKYISFFGEGAIAFSKRSFGDRIFGGQCRFLMYHSIEKDLWIDVVS